MAQNQESSGARTVDYTQVHEDVVGELHQGPTRTICVAIDNSDFSKYAFDWMVQNIVRKETDQIVILNVRPFAMSPYSTLGAMPIVDMSIEKSNRAASHDLIRAYASHLLKAGIKCRGIALRGDIRDEIVFKVDQIKADMLVIGSRGMGAFKRAFLGSVSDYCVHHCHCPVVVPKMMTGETVPAITNPTPVKESEEADK